MGPTWVLSSPGVPHVGPMNLAMWVASFADSTGNIITPEFVSLFRRVATGLVKWPCKTVLFQTTITKCEANARIMCVMRDNKLYIHLLYRCVHTCTRRPYGYVMLADDIASNDSSDIDFASGEVLNFGLKVRSSPLLRIGVWAYTGSEDCLNVSLKAAIDILFICLW